MGFDSNDSTSIPRNNLKSVINNETNKKYFLIKCNELNETIGNKKNENNEKTIVPNSCQNLDLIKTFKCK